MITLPASYTRPGPSERKPRLWLQVVPLKPPVTAWEEWVDRMHRWEQAPVGRRFAEILNEGVIPSNAPDYHIVYGMGKQEAAIDWVRGEIMCRRLSRPFIWHISGLRAKWWHAAFDDTERPIVFFGGARLEKLKNKNQRWASADSVRMGVGHVGLLTSPAAFLLKFNRTSDVVFVDFPLRSDMVRQAIDMTLRHNPFKNVHVYFLCMEGTLDERVTRMMRDEVLELYRQPQKSVALIENT